MRKTWTLLLLVALGVLTACGGSSGSPAPPQPPPPPSSPAYLFVANSGDSTISRFAINNNGGLRSLGAASPIAPGRNPQALALSNNSFLLSANQDTYDTGVFAIASQTGDLTQVSGSPFWDFGGQHNGIAVHPSGKFAYVTSMPVGIVGLEINASTGQLAIVTDSPFGTTSESTPVIDPAGKYLYTVGFQTINVYAINSTTGGLTAISGSPFPSHAQSITGLTMHPSGKFLLGVEGGYLFLHSYSIDANTGALQEVSGSPIWQVGVDPWSVVVSGNFAFTSNVSRGTIATWRFDSVNGTFTWAGEVNAGTFPQALVLDSTGKFLYAANYRSNNVSAYSINATTGALTELPGSPFTVGVFPAALVTTK